MTKEWPTTCPVYRCQWKWWLLQVALGLLVKMESLAVLGPQETLVYQDILAEWADLVDKDPLDHEDHLEKRVIRELVKWGT